MITAAWRASWIFWGSNSGGGQGYGSNRTVERRLNPHMAPPHYVAAGPETGVRAVQARTALNSKGGRPRGYEDHGWCRGCPTGT